ncbi:MAG: ankyrin repeat domain-containing protein, partial [Candidatus Hydrogenedentes bacterium]|nr:ankyrin repeat domain-containing protein [Candidatus Hydrogenedentota bacterium]
NTGLTPLHVAAFMSRPACAEKLLKAGARIDATDVFGDTPLHSAAIHGMTGMIGFLVRRGADPNAVNKKGETPLDLAVKYEQERVVETVQKLMKPLASEG